MKALDYEDGCFDAVISRNLTWTLPDPERAYGQWFRVLKPGGVLLNFDADYAANVRSRSTQNRRVPADSPYGHVGMTDRLQRENDEITLTMDVGRARPAWDREALRTAGWTPGWGGGFWGSWTWSTRPCSALRPGSPDGKRGAHHAYICHL